MARDVRPYYVPSPYLIDASPWLRLVDGEWERVGDFIENWDYRTKLHLKCTLTADTQALRTESHLTDGSPLSFVVGHRALDTYLVGPATRIPLVDGLSEVALEIDADHAGSAIEITRKLVLERDRLSAHPGEARHAGSILWDDEHKLRLTGSEPMFPTEAVDFEAFGIDKRASWHLIMPPGPDDPAMGSLLLLLNSADRRLVSAVQKERNLTPEELVLLEEMEENVVTEIVRWALARWDDLDECDRESFGAAARLLTMRVLPDPAAWTPESQLTASMDLRSLMIGGARGIGFGQRVS